MDKKRIVSGAVLSSDRARAMVKARTEKYRRAMVERIMGEATSIDPTVQTPADAYGLLAAKQWQTLMDSEKPAIDQLDKLRRMMTGETGVESQRDHEPATPPNGTIAASVDTLLALVQQIEEHKRAAVDKARALDAE